eukprot:CAMPEP_0184324952 /NCGR_PEP_ID=MMETSP1049-20130417/137744_1 /TAXON_ID=77928 /ORGANISM="Proteomonas sulcata, Strain CCMP704" /LENGTH=192 /DNA_ID=CAMNT_0026646857 /DNA_START=247 /DNA_END=825 /DNA_ORIENTATION=-
MENLTILTQSDPTSSGISNTSVAAELSSGVGNESTDLQAAALGGSFKDQDPDSVDMRHGGASGPGLSTVGVCPVVVEGSQHRLSVTIAWDGVENGAQESHPAGKVKGCRCCFPPDTMFEDACMQIMDLGLVSSKNAEKFVRLCGAGSGNMQLSKSKTKIALKLGQNGLLTADQVQAMQQCVDEAYSEILGCN